MVVKEIVYFDKPGPQNTSEVIEAVKKRQEELDIKYLVIASNSGETALKFWNELKDKDVKIICVSQHAGFSGGDKLDMTPETYKDLDTKGVNVLITSHILSGVERSISNKFGGVSHVEIIAHTLRRIGQGIKVAVEISIMAADAALIPTDTEIIAVGGEWKGCRCRNRP